MGKKSRKKKSAKDVADEECPELIKHTTTFKDASVCSRTRERKERRIREQGKHNIVHSAACERTCSSKKSRCGATPSISL